MKLLIVDDEELTRSGVISSIDWERLGITEIWQADDGIHGLELARKHLPEIILCDVRMPRMSGIDMLTAAEAFLPDSAVVFMSGYSDKEYLKAAIRLKAVNYIEKPIDPAELREAILSAIEHYRRNCNSHRGADALSQENAAGLAGQLTVPFGANEAEIRSLAAELNLTLNESTCFTALIVHLDSSADQTAAYLEAVRHGLTAFMEGFGIRCLSASRRLQYLVYILISPGKPAPEIIRAAASYLKSQFDSHGNYCLAAGETCAGIQNAYQSYASAVVLLQNGFFFLPGTIMDASAIQGASERRKDLPLPEERVFQECLQEKSREKAFAFLASLQDYFTENTVWLPNQAKDLYYRLFSLISRARAQAQLPDAEENGSILTSLEKSFCFRDLHDKLSRQTGLLFQELDGQEKENSTILLIKDYISSNYMNDTLSVKDISAHVFLSASYVCTFFKNETGQTLNQYLTEYRMEMAKKLLCDPRYRITEISSRVGYSDGNYFGKSFKKYAGVSPSEYRERMT